MHTMVGVEKTLDFLQKTRICTRKWHLERLVEEHEVQHQEEEEAEGQEQGGEQEE
jgi:hypothetical protein